MSVKDWKGLKREVISISDSCCEKISRKYNVSDREARQLFLEALSKNIVQEQLDNTVCLILKNKNNQFTRSLRIKELII